MYNFSLLSFLIFLPILGSLAICILPKSYAKICTLIITLLELLISIYVFKLFEPSNPNLQLIESVQWLDGMSYSLGIDGLSVLLVLLTTFLMPICIVVSWKNDILVKQYMICFLLLESFILGSFCINNLLLFFIFFEAVLIPMYLIIGIWGGENRVYAALKFFLYTLVGSFPLLLSILYIYFYIETTDIQELTLVLPNLSLETQKWLWIGFFTSFAVKLPMWPFHTWLPDAHVQAPTSGSIILAGILLKLGGYGFIRFSISMFPDASKHFSDFVFYLSITAVIYTSIVALMQQDMKKLVAYSSIAHMGYVTAGIFSLNFIGVQGAIFQMVSHGLVSGGLFLCVGVLYDRKHTKEIAFYNGLANKMPKFAMIFMIFTLASVALPITSGFIGEFFVLMGSFQYNKIFGIMLSTGIVLGATYMFRLFKEIMYGEVKNEQLNNIQDIDTKEKIIFFSIVILIFGLGLYPMVITNNTKSFVKKTLSIIDSNK